MLRYFIIIRDFRRDLISSTKIIKNFYSYIAEGLPKDQALRNAKIDYITNAEGRTRAPQYWAGLVLIGDTAPIDIKTSSHLVFWILGFVVMIILGLVIHKKRAA